MATEVPSIEQTKLPQLGKPSYLVRKPDLHHLYSEIVGRSGQQPPHFWARAVIVDTPF